MDLLKKIWYYLAIVGLVILGVAIYSAFFKSSELKDLLKQRPIRKPGSLKLPEAPSIIDYVDLYRKKLKRL